MPGCDIAKEQLLACLSRVEGQVRSLRQMVEADRDRIDVLTQISARRRRRRAWQLGGAIAIDGLNKS